jgi:hypothetical protein
VINREDPRTSGVAQPSTTRTPWPTTNLCPVTHVHEKCLAIAPASGRHHDPHTADSQPASTPGLVAVAPTGVPTYLPLSHLRLLQPLVLLGAQAHLPTSADKVEGEECSAPGGTRPPLRWQVEERREDGRGRF